MKSKEFVVLSLSLMVVLQATLRAENLLQLPNDFNVPGLLFEQYGDNRPANVLNPGPTSATALTFGGIQSVGNSGSRY